MHVLTHRGPSIQPVLDRFAAQRLWTPFEGYAKGVELLQRRRGEVLIGDRLAVVYAAAQAGVELAELPVYVRRDQVAYKLSRKSFSAEQLEEFNQALQRLEGRGELARIRNRWLPAGLHQKP